MVLSLPGIASVGNSISSTNDDEIFIPEMLDKKSDIFHKHTKRLPKAEDLYSFVYQNEDETNTIYMFNEPIKYIDEKGEVKIKSVKLSLEKKHYVNDKNDIKIKISKDLYDGVSLSHEKSTIELKPYNFIKTFRKNSVQTEKDTIRQNNLFAKGVDLSYSTLLSGFKTNIIINEPQEECNFSFILKTHGQKLHKDQNGNINIINSVGEIIQLSEMMIFDSRGYVADVQVTIEEVIGNDEYLITFLPNQEFLKDEETVYPLAMGIDTIKQFESSDAIQYIATYSGGSTQTNINQTNHGNIYVGRGTKGIGRALYRFPILYNRYFNTHVGKNITKVRLVQGVENQNLYGLNVNPYTGSMWSGSTQYSDVQWDNYASGYNISTTYGGKYIENNNCRYMYIDFTSLLNHWKNYPTMLNPDRGIMVVNSIGEYIMNWNNVSIYTYHTTVGPTYATFPPYLEITYNAVKIMLDAGHYTGYNQGAYPLYFEGTKMWELQNYLKSELESYGFIVGTTRPVASVDLGLEARGGKAEDHDMFLSLHSNSYTSSSVNRIDVIYDLNNKNNASAFAQTIGNTVKNAMNADGTLNISTVSIWAESYKYGVLIAAAKTNCPLYYIIEHSYHSNYASAYWLYSSSNLASLAAAEALAINNYYKNN